MSVTKPASEYQFNEILLDAERSFNTGIVDQPFDLKGMTGEVNIFEDLTKGYLTAKVVVLDDLGLMTEVVELQGTETITFDISGTDEEKLRGSNIKLEMRVVSIVKQVRTNDRASVFVINAISPHAYKDSAIKLSRSYTGKLEDIAEKILDTYLDTKVERPSKTIASGEESMQERVKVVIPYISPLESLEWLMERATGKGGSPFFAWAPIGMQDASTGDGAIRYGTFKTMIVEGIAEALSNENKQFKYNVGTVAREPSAESQRKSIVEFTHNNIENTLNMINQGTVGSRISSVDTYTTQKSSKHFDLGEYIEQLRGLTGAGNVNLLGTVFDEDNKVTIEDENKNPSEFDGRVRNLVTSYGTYEWENSYHDVFDQTLLMSKVRKSAVLSMFYKNVLEVTVPGYNILKEDVSVGEILSFDFMTQRTDTEEGDPINERDERTSGLYLILGARHVFNGTKYRVILSTAKVADLPGA
jgi:hypothetical protein